MFPNLPPNAFIHPCGENRDAIASLIQQVSAQIVDHLSQASRHSPIPAADRLPAVEIPAVPVAVSELLTQIQGLMAQSMNPAHPGYMGHMDPIPSTFSILGDWVASALNNNMLSVEMSPALSRLEPLLLREIAQMFGLGERAGGVLVSGGSLANLQALIVARNAKLQVLQRGLVPFGKPPVVLASELAHTSVKKAAMLAGLGTDGVIAVPVNGLGHMDPEAVRSQIHQARAAGQYPFMIVATVGTTITGNIDPLEALAPIAQDNDLWFHVDAAYGGALIFSEQHRHRLQGIEQADSVTFNPQKWLYVTKACASVLFRDMAILEDHFRLAAPYMNTAADWTNLGEITIQGTRHGDILKLWLTLQHLGHAGCAALVDTSYHLTQIFAAEIQRRPSLTMATPPEMNILCFRSCPPHLAPAAWDLWNQQLQDYLLHHHQLFLSLPVFRGQRWLKAVLLNPFTTDADIQRLFAAIDDFTERGSAAAKA